MRPTDELDDERIDAYIRHTNQMISDTIDCAGNGVATSVDGVAVVAPGSGDCVVTELLPGNRFGLHVVSGWLSTVDHVR